MDESKIVNGPTSENDSVRRRNNARLENNEYPSNKTNGKNKHHKSNYAVRDKKLKWPKKEFKLQNSYLTDAFKNLDVRCGRHVCYVVWIMWTIRLTVVDYSKNENFQIPGISTLKQSLGGIQYYLLSHVMFSILALILFAGFRVWYSTRKVINISTRKIFDYTCTMFLILYMSALIFVPWWWIFTISWLGPFVKEWIVSEQVRICMKIIAFVSTKVYQTLEETDKLNNRIKHEKDASLKDSACPSLRKFAYFLYAPTLIYSDDYPRNEKIRWMFVLENMIDILIVFHVGFTIFERELQPSVLSYLLEQKPTSILLLMLETSLPFVTLLILLMTACWHSLQNVFAEILRFGDRGFYADWWNEGTAAGFHRCNNMVVQDWLFNYIYYPVKKRTASSLAAQMTVLFLSAIVHDVMLGVALRFALPVVVSNFVILALCLRFLRNDRNRESLNNLMYLMSFPCGVASMGCFIAVEYFAREMCQRKIESSWDYFYPRFWNCTLIN